MRIGKDSFNIIEQYCFVRLFEKTEEGYTEL